MRAKNSTNAVQNSHHELFYEARLASVAADGWVPDSKEQPPVCSDYCIPPLHKLSPVVSMAVMNSQQSLDPAVAHPFGKEGRREKEH